MKEGDNWSEELGFSPTEFRTAFAKIGIVYRSKKAFKASSDLFKGKYYASYYDRIKGLTYYLRNDKALDSLFLEAGDSKVTEAPAVNLEKTESSASRAEESSVPLSLNNNKLLTSVKDTHIKAGVPFEIIKELFNEICMSYPKLTMLTP
ncbi:MAG: hypothetical protein K0S71_1864 [Clostridia bacterium]|jgi:hypothetical protein|nr:hypothetical protein [Clostridia bacterium]